MDKRRLLHALGIAGAAVAGAAVVYAVWVLVLDLFWDSVVL